MAKLDFKNCFVQFDFEEVGEGKGILRPRSGWWGLSRALL